MCIFKPSEGRTRENSYRVTTGQLCPSRDPETQPRSSTKDGGRLGGFPGGGRDLSEHPWSKQHPPAPALQTRGLASTAGGTVSKPRAGTPAVRPGKARGWGCVWTLPKEQPSVLSASQGHWLLAQKKGRPSALHMFPTQLRGKHGTGQVVIVQSLSHVRCLAIPWT